MQTISRSVGQADSTEPIQTVTFDTTTFPDYDSSQFPLSYSVEPYGSSVGIPLTVSIDTSVTPNVIAITVMDSAEAGTYGFMVYANHMN